VVFGKTKDQLSPFIKNKIICDLLSGAFAGFCSTLANNPIDVCKTKMQGVDGKGKTFTGVFSNIYATQGFMGFYSGVKPRLLRVMLDAALTFSVFHQLKRWAAAYIAGRS
jgi:hypothetical protein